MKKTKNKFLNWFYKKIISEKELGGLLGKADQTIHDRLISPNIWYSLLCLGIAVLLLNYQWLNDLLEKFSINAEIFVSVALAFLLNGMAAFIAATWAAKGEDKTKLTADYNSLNQRYCLTSTIMNHQNQPLSSDNYVKKGRKATYCQGQLDDTLGDMYQMAVCDLVRLCGQKVEIEDHPKKKYQAPEFSVKHYQKLMKSHQSSLLFNQLNFRVDDFIKTEDSIRFCFSRTTYFDSMITNRAMDYKIEGISVRDLYSIGPDLESLKESVLSNHLGFNGMIETSDNKFIFIKRNKHVSIGKGTIQCSIAASLKSKRVLNQQNVVTIAKIEEAIKKEIEDELNLKSMDGFVSCDPRVFEDFSFEKNVLYFYRDMVEGGKPQLMFYAKINMTSDAIKNTFKKERTLYRKLTMLRYSIFHIFDREESIYDVDGNDMIVVDREELMKIYITPDKLVIRNRAYPAMPSAAATVAMLIREMKEHPEMFEENEL